MECFNTCIENTRKTSEMLLQWPNFWPGQLIIGINLVKLGRGSFTLAWHWHFSRFPLAWRWQFLHCSDCVSDMLSRGKGWLWPRLVSSTALLAASTSPLHLLKLLSLCLHCGGCCAASRLLRLCLWCLTSSSPDMLSIWNSIQIDYSDTAFHSDSGPGRP